MSNRFDWAAPGDEQEDAWLVRFCDKDCGEATFTGADAAREAWEYWNRYAPSYNLYVFRLARLNDEAPPSAPMVDNDLIGRLRGHSMALLEHGKYPPDAHALTNADAASYGQLLAEAAAALEPKQPPATGSVEIRNDR